MRPTGAAIMTIRLAMSALVTVTWSFGQQIGTLLVEPDRCPESPTRGPILVAESRRPDENQDEFGGQAGLSAERYTKAADANFNNRRPTPIDGVWRVVSGPDEGTGSTWRQVFFERNRAFWVTFRAEDGTDELHHFEVDEQGVVRIWQTWLEKGPLIMEGRVTDDSRLQLDLAGAQNNQRLVLQRQRPAR